MVATQLVSSVTIRSAGRRSTAGNGCGDPPDLEPVEAGRKLHVIYCEGGRAEYSGGSRGKTAGLVGPGDALVVWSGADLSFDFSEAEPYNMLGVTLVAADAEDARRVGATLLGDVGLLVGAGSEPPRPFLSGSAAEAVRHHTEAIAREMKQARIGWRVATRAHLDLLFTELIRHASEKNKAIQGSYAELPSAVETAHSYFLEKLDDPGVCLRDTSRQAGLSGKRLIALFKEAGLSSPMAHLRGLRLEQARKLLKRSDLRVSEVASRVGIPRPSHFSRLYRRSFGVSPSEDRLAAVGLGAE